MSKYKNLLTDIYGEDWSNRLEEIAKQRKAVNHVRREIEFFFKNPDKTNPFVDDQYIEVAEYADL